MCLSEGSKILGGELGTGIAGIRVSLVQDVKTQPSETDKASVDVIGER